uniref:Uncharacterized protein n=1 Tax=Anopheles farauti TaxID=69004 RepID=A0A182Q4L6_9DIPT
MVDTIENTLHLPVEHIVQDGLVEGETARQQLLPAPLVHGKEAPGACVPPPGQLASLLGQQCLEQGSVLVGDSSQGGYDTFVVDTVVDTFVHQHHGRGGGVGFLSVCLWPTVERLLFRMKSAHFGRFTQSQTQQNEPTNQSKAAVKIN